MPQRARLPCPAPGCPNLQPCPAHARPVDRGERDPRPTAHQRGYGATWRRLRAIVLARHPVCADPFSLHRGAVVLATDVDHIMPKAAGGRDVENNLQALCHSCHSHKTALQNNFGGRGGSNR